MRVLLILDWELELVPKTDSWNETNVNSKQLTKEQQQALHYGDPSIAGLYCDDYTLSYVDIITGKNE